MGVKNKTYISLTLFINLGPVVEVSTELIGGRKVFRFVTLDGLIDVQILLAERGQHRVLLPVHHIFSSILEVQILDDIIFVFAI